MASVLVWTVPTDLPISPAYSRFLSPDEWERAQRFRLPGDRQRYRVMRTVLRMILGKTLACDPREIVFGYTPTGKPYLRDPADSLAFNVSHSGDYGLVGIFLDGLIGVDLEQMQVNANVQKLAQRFFASAESEVILAHFAPQQQQLFYRYWTAKEAFLKATGLGISGGLDRVIVSPYVDQYDALPDPHQGPDWQLWSRPLFDNYWAAIAVSPKYQYKDGFNAQFKLKPFNWEDF